MVLKDDGSSRMGGGGGSAGNSRHGDNGDRLFASSVTSDVTNRSGDHTCICTYKLTHLHTCLHTYMHTRPLPHRPPISRDNLTPTTSSLILTNSFQLQPQPNPNPDLNPNPFESPHIRWLDSAAVLLHLHGITQGIRHDSPGKN